MDKQVRRCQVCKREVSRNADYCSTACEIKDLRSKVAEDEKKVKSALRRRGGGRCIGRVQWSTCVQEYYLKDSYDAKRRAHALRELGYTAEAKNFGRMPVKTKTGTIIMRQITILTAWGDAPGNVPPEPSDFVDLL